MYGNGSLTAQCLIFIRIEKKDIPLNNKSQPGQGQVKPSSSLETSTVFGKEASFEEGAEREGRPFLRYGGRLSRSRVLIISSVNWVMTVQARNWARMAFSKSLWLFVD